MVRLNVHLDMTIVVDWDVKLQTKQTNLKVFEILEHLPYSRLAPVSNVIFFSKTDNLSKIAIYKLYLQVEILSLDI